MRNLSMLVLVAALSAPAAYAGDMPKASIGGYVTMTDVDAGGGAQDDGMGFGVRGWAVISNPWFVHGEYQTSSLDDSNTDIDQLRIGGGLAGEIQPGMMWLAKGEYISVGNDFADDQTGFGVHGGMMFHPSQQFGLFGTLGYLTTSDTDGLEFNIGGSFSFTRALAAFIDYRTYMGSVDPSGDLDVSDLHIGVALMFY